MGKSVHWASAMNVLLFLAAGYLLLVVFTYLFQPRMLYLPHVPGRGLDVSPENIGLRYEDIALQAADGVRLHGWFVPAAGEGSRVVLFFHGNAGNISHRLDSIRQFHGLGHGVLIIDYRGYGRSEGKTSEVGTYRDAQAAWRYLTELRGFSPNQIVVFGRSLGGAIAAWLAAEQRPGGLIIESTFTSIPDIGRELYPFLPVRWLSRFQYATKTYVQSVQCPVLVVHSRDDEIIPFRHAEQILEMAHEPRTLLPMHGPHNGAHILSEHSYIDGLSRFLGGL